MPGDPAAALGACLFWHLVRNGNDLKRISSMVIAEGVTVGEVTEWVGEDVTMITKERRLLLSAAAGLLASKATHHYQEGSVDYWPLILQVRGHALDFYGNAV